MLLIILTRYTKGVLYVETLEFLLIIYLLLFKRILLILRACLKKPADSSLLNFFWFLTCVEDKKKKAAKKMSVLETLNMLVAKDHTLVEFVYFVNSNYFSLCQSGEEHVESWCDGACSVQNLNSVQIVFWSRYWNESKKRYFIFECFKKKDIFNKLYNSLFFFVN